MPSSEKLKFFAESIHHREVAPLLSAACPPLLVDDFDACFDERWRLLGVQLTETTR